MYKKGTDNIILTIEEQDNTKQGFDNAMYEIQEQLSDFDTYYIESGCAGNFAMAHFFYNLNRDVGYCITDLDVMLAMDSNELIFLAYELEDDEKDEIMRAWGFDLEDEYEDDFEDLDSLDLEALNYTGEQFAELQFEYDSGVYTY